MSRHSAQDILNLDQYIETLNEGKQISENDIKILCRNISNEFNKIKLTPQDRYKSNDFN